MSKKLYPTDVPEQAQSVLATWKQIGPSTQYEIVGGTRLSKHKSPTRKAKT